MIDQRALTGLIFLRIRTDKIRTLFEHKLKNQYESEVNNVNYLLGVTVCSFDLGWILDSLNDWGVCNDLTTQTDTDVPGPLPEPITENEYSRFYEFVSDIQFLSSVISTVYSLERLFWFGCPSNRLDYCFVSAV